MGTVGAGTQMMSKPQELPDNFDAESTLKNAQAQLDGPANTETICRELGALRGAIHAMRQDQKAMQDQLA